MKFLCAHEHMASHFIYSGLGEALRDLGHEFVFWQPDRQPAIPVFDQYKPDIFFGQGYNLDRATLKALERHPNTKVVLKVGIWGSIGDTIDTQECPVLMKSETELANVSQVRNPLVLFNYCHPKRVQGVIGHWSNEVDCSLWGFLPAANPKVYYPADQKEELRCDFAFVGGYWGYKAVNLDKYIIPLCYPVGKYNVKIFGNQAWPVSQYMGPLPDELVSHLLSSATICPNIHEPHSNIYGFDIVARVFNICAAKGFMITDYVESLVEDVFTNGEVISVKTPEEFLEQSRYFLANPDERIPYMEKAYSTVMKEHTYIDRALALLEILDAGQK